MVIKKCFIDLETTGLDPNLNGILEIAIITRIPGQQDQSFQTFIKPIKNDLIVPAALAVNKIRFEDAEKFPESAKVHNDLTNFLGQFVNKFDPEDKFIFVAYNANFDYQFLRSFFVKCDDKYFGSLFFYPPLDIMQIAFKHLLNVRHKMPNFKQVTVAPELGIEIDLKKAHGAMYDVEIVRKIHDTLCV